MSPQPPPGFNLRLCRAGYYWESPGQSRWRCQQTDECIVCGAFKFKLQYMPRSGPVNFNLKLNFRL